jgi:hypothetical protein
MLGDDVAREPAQTSLGPYIAAQRCMRVGIVGGAEKKQARYHELAKAAGCQVEFHHGHMKGRGPDELRALVARCDIVVIITRVNSHGAVRLARQLLRKHERDALIVRRFGLRYFEDVMRQRAPAPQAA